MGLKLEKITTSEGIVLENPYCNINSFSYNKDNHSISFSILFYKDEEAYNNNCDPLISKIIVDTIPADRLDLTKNLIEEIYHYIKIQSKIANGDEELFNKYKVKIDKSLQKKKQYIELKGSEDVFEEGQELETLTDQRVARILEEEPEFSRGGSLPED